MPRRGLLRCARNDVERAGACILRDGACAPPQDEVSDPHGEECGNAARPRTMLASPIEPRGRRKPRSPLRPKNSSRSHTTPWHSD